MGDKLKRVKLETVEGQSEQGPSAVEESILEKILRISVIADKLWANLSIDQLRSCRLVHSAWNHSIVAEMTRRNTPPRLQFSCRSSPGSCSPFVLTRFRPSARFKIEFFPFGESTGGPGPRDHKLEDLTHLLTQGQELAHTKTRFPCSNYKFTDGDLNGADSRLFFSKFGGWVRTLHLERIFGLSPSILFRGQLNNLRKLSLVTVKLDLDLDPKSEGDLTFPFLTTIHIEDSIEDDPPSPLLLLLIKLIRLAPNLKYVGNLPLAGFQFSSDPAIHRFFTDPNSRVFSLLTGLILSLPTIEQADSEKDTLTRNLETLSQGPGSVRLRILTLAHPTGALPGPRLTCFLMDILQKSALSLTVLHLTFSRFFSESTTLVLPTVKFLSVDVSKGQGEQFDEVNMTKIFPNLSYIYVRLVRQVIYDQEKEAEERNQAETKSGRRKWKKMKWSQYFTNTNATTGTTGTTAPPSFASVESLEILGPFPESWWKPLGQLFPQVRICLLHLIRGHGYYPSYNPDIGSWKPGVQDFQGFTIASTPVKARHEAFVLCLDEHPQKWGIPWGKCPKKFCWYTGQKLGQY